MRTLTVSLMLLGLVGSAWAQVKYTDEAGNAHYVGTLDQVPEKYRAKAGQVGSLPQIRADDGAARRSLGAAPRQSAAPSQSAAPPPSGRVSESQSVEPSLLPQPQSSPALQDAAEFERVSGLCQAYVNRQPRYGRNRVEGAKEFKVSANGGTSTVNTYGTDAARFAWADCMRQSGYPVR
jgi:hypothetical protein